MSLEVTYEGVYASNVGEHKQTVSFNYKHKVVGEHTDCLESHLKKRYVPMMIQNDKKKPIFNNLVSFRLISYEIAEDENKLIGKDIMNLSEWEIQELARMYNLFEIPLPFTTAIQDARQKAAFQYLKKVLNLKISTDKEKEKFKFFKKDLSGSWVLDFGEEPLTIQLIKKEKEKENKTEKLSLEDVLSLQQVGDDIKLPDADSLEN